MSDGARRPETLEEEVARLRAEVARLGGNPEAAPPVVAGVHEAQWRFVTEHLQDVTFYQLRISPQGERRFVYLSDAVERMHGITAEAVCADANLLYRQIHEDDLAGLLAAEEESRRTGLPFHCEARFRRPDGELRWTLIRSAPYALAGGGGLWVGAELDVTDRRQVEEALRESEDRFRAVVEQSPFSMMVFSPEGVAVHVNAAHCRLWGVRPERVLGFKPLEDAQLGAKGLWPYFRRAFAGEQVKVPPAEYDLSATFGAGQTRIVQGEFYPTRNEKGELAGVILIHQDVTERERNAREQQQLQEQLQQAMKMEAVGRLAGGVAHDFNNLLTVIIGNLELARLDLRQEQAVRLYLEETLKAADSASALVRQLLAFSRRQIIEPKVVDLNELVRQLQKMLGRLLGEDVGLELALCAGLGAVKVDPGQLEQVLVNLSVNARDAMPDGGRLVIETSNVELDADYCARHPEAEPGSFVMLAVSDTGQGMSAEVKKHLFEPFFTTKPKGRGTGLGLATTFGAVKQLGGTIEVYSEEGHGTTVKVYLPRVGEAVPAHPAAEARVVRAPRQETILLVEDEPSVRRLATVFMERLGYRTLQAANGEEALRLAREHAGPIDLLVTDVVMPGMNGRELAKRLKLIRPDVAVLYSSGFTENVIVHHGIVEEGLSFIAKPYSMAALASKLSAVLDAARGQAMP